MRSRPLLSATVGFLLLVGGCTDTGSDRGAATATTPVSTATPSGQTAPTGGKTIDYDDARAFIEDNATDRDLGFHFELGGEPFATAILTDPNGNVVFDLTSGGSLTQQGFSTLFVESAEYGLNKLSRDEFLARFPAGNYTFAGQTLDGRMLTGTWAFSHLIPDPPSITSPDEGATVDRGAVTIAWQPVTTPAGVEVEVYQLEVFPVDPPKGLPPIDFFVEVPPTVTEMQVPAEVLTPGADYMFELIVIDVTGNQTIAIGTFTTSG